MCQYKTEVRVCPVIRHDLEPCGNVSSSNSSAGKVTVNEACEHYKKMYKSLHGVEPTAASRLCRYYMEEFAKVEAGKCSYCYKQARQEREAAEQGGREQGGASGEGGEASGSGSAGKAKA